MAQRRSISHSGNYFSDTHLYPIPRLLPQSPLRRLPTRSQVAETLSLEGGSYPLHRRAVYPLQDRDQLPRRRRTIGDREDKRWGALRDLQSPRRRRKHAREATDQSSFNAHQCSQALMYHNMKCNCFPSMKQHKQNKGRVSLRAQSSPANEGVKSQKPRSLSHISASSRSIKSRKVHVS